MLEVVCLLNSIFCGINLVYLFDILKFVPQHKYLELLTTKFKAPKQHPTFVD